MVNSNLTIKSENLSSTQVGGNTTTHHCHLLLKESNFQDFRPTCWTIASIYHLNCHYQQLKLMVMMMIPIVKIMTETWNIARDQNHLKKFRKKQRNLGKMQLINCCSWTKKKCSCFNNTHKTVKFVLWRNCHTFQQNFCHWKDKVSYIWIQTVCPSVRPTTFWQRFLWRNRPQRIT